MPRVAGAVLSLALLLGAGCGWSRDRLLDASDVFDLKYGWGLGLGAKVGATAFFGLGVGASLANTVEWAGRHAVQPGDGVFLGIGVASLDASGLCCSNDHPQAVNVLGVEIVAWQAAFRGELPFLQWWRFGAEVMPVVGRFGLYLNVGELVDLLAGLVTLDPAGDDGEPKTVVSGDERPAVLSGEFQQP